jgi:hypothetical protein
MRELAVGFRVILLQFRCPDNAEPVRLEWPRRISSHHPALFFEPEAHFSARGKAVTIALRSNR